MLQVVGTPSDPQLARPSHTLQDWVDSGGPPDRPRPGRPVRPPERDPDHGRLVAAGCSRPSSSPRWATAFFDAVHDVLGLRQRAQQPRRPPRQRLPGRLVRIRLQGPAARARPARRGPLLAHLLRQRIADRLPRRAAPGALATRSPSRRRRSTTRTTAPPGTAPRGRVPGRQERPVVLRLGALPPDRRGHRAHDPLDQPAHLPAGRRDPGPPARAATRGPKGASPLRVSLVPAYRACSSPNRAARRRRSRSAPATRPRSARTTSPSARRTRTATRRDSVGPHAARASSPATRPPPTDEADVNAHLQPHRRAPQSDLSDYTGQLQASSRPCASPTATTTRRRAAATTRRPCRDFPFPVDGALHGDAGSRGGRHLQRDHHASTRSCRARSRRATARSGSSARSRCSTAARTASPPPRRTRCSRARASSFPSRLRSRSRAGNMPRCLHQGIENRFGPGVRVGHPARRRVLLRRHLLRRAGRARDGTGGADRDVGDRVRRARRSSRQPPCWPTAAARRPRSWPESY